jgi:hypothetical protein
MSLPHALKRIRIQLARSKEFPSGSPERGYEFVAPLTTDGHIDASLWHKYRQHCRVRRFWEGQDDQLGNLIHSPGGTEHAQWLFDYDSRRRDDDEVGFRFGAHTFAPGEYVSLRDNDSDLHTFQVMSVEPAV